ncbi:MAG: hypothetical protein J1E07_10645 [Treponema sp.]|nr:hypothetical protein [Treponema sp.]
MTSRTYRTVCLSSESVAGKQSELHVTQCGTHGKVNAPAHQAKKSARKSGNLVIFGNYIFGGRRE